MTYNAQIKYLSENPNRISDHWYVGRKLFKFLETEAGDYRGGCLTMIKKEPHRFFPMIGDVVLTQLRDEIVADDRIPTDVEQITVEHLPVFKEYQEKYDKLVKEFK